MFPLLPPAELEALAKDIEKHDLRERVVVATVKTGVGWTDYLLDGRNRLDAMEKVLGWEVVACLHDHRTREAASRCTAERVRLSPWVSSLGPQDDPAAYVISANIRRRHLTKRQQADLIVAAVKAGRTVRKGTAKAEADIDRSPVETRRAPGRPADAVKAQVVAEAAKLGIGKTTAMEALVDAEPDRRKQRKPAPVPVPRAVPDLQVLVTEAAESLAGRLAQTGHGTVKVKVEVKFSDATEILSTTIRDELRRETVGPMADAARQVEQLEEHDER